jgi:hypothetical protein
VQESEVGFLTVVGCVGNMIASFGFGYLFDYISSKRMSLALAAVVSAGTYLLFLPSKTKAELYMSQFAVSAGTGLLYTVQCAMVRLLADERIGASFFGLVLSSMNIAALIGTALAGAISSDVDATPQTLPAATGYDGYEWCYIIGAIMGLLGLGLVPWITAQDPNLRDAPPAESLGTSLRKLQRRASVYLGLAAPRPEDFGDDGAALSGAAPVPFASPAKVQGNPLQQKQAAAAAAAGDDDGAPPPPPQSWLPPMGSMRGIIGEEGKGWRGLLQSRVFDRVAGRHKREVARERAVARANNNYHSAADARRAGDDDDADDADDRNVIRGSHVPRSLTDKATLPLPYVAGAAAPRPRPPPGLPLPPPPPPPPVVLPAPPPPAYSQYLAAAGGGGGGGGGGGSTSGSLASDHAHVAAGGVGVGSLGLGADGGAFAAAAAAGSFSGSYSEGSAHTAGGVGGGGGGSGAAGDAMLSLAEAQRRERIQRMGLTQGGGGGGGGGVAHSPAAAGGGLGLGAPPRPPGGGAPRRPAEL